MGQVADAQLITIAMTVLSVLGGTLMTNSRLTDLKQCLGADFRASLRVDFTQLGATMDARFDAMERKLDEITRLLANHDNASPASNSARISLTR